jgi:hypothetical protein
MLCATSGLMHCSKKHYSITSSARTSSIWGIVRLRAFAVFRLMTNSSWVGNSIGKSEGFAPLSMRSSVPARARHYRAVSATARAGLHFIPGLST